MADRLLLTGFDRIELRTRRDRTNAHLNLDDCDVMEYGGEAFISPRPANSIETIALGRKYL